MALEGLGFADLGLKPEAGDWPCLWHLNFCGFLQTSG